METQQYLNNLWSLHLSRADRPSLLQYLEEFSSVYQKLLLLTHDVEGNEENHQDEQFVSTCYKFQGDGSVLLHHLPDKLLQIIQTQLMTLQDHSSELKLPDIRLATYLVKALVIVSRSNNRALRQRSSALVDHVVIIASQVILMLSKNSSFKAEERKKFEEFLENLFLFLECIYDPCFAWKKKVTGLPVTPCAIEVPFLNVEVIPFFYDALQIHASHLSVTVQQNLLHMFGSILSGFQRNALLATSSHTLETLLKYLSQYMQQNDVESPSSSSSDEENVTLVLRLLVLMVHTLHNSGPDQCQLDVKKVIEEYLKLISEASSNPNMQLLMISFIPEMLNTKDRAALQMMLLQHGSLQHLKHVLANFKASSSNDAQSADQFAIQFINIVSCLVAGSMSAKDLFSKTLGTSFLLTHFKAICVPSKDVLISLLRMGVESVDVLTNPEPIKNVFIILMLFDWLPEIKQVEQQTWLSAALSKIFLSCTTNKIMACHSKLMKRVIGLLLKHTSLHQQTVLNLIRLIEVLGSYSMTPKQTLALLELLRQDSISHQHMNKYFNELMNSLTLMAHKDILDRKPAYFFDLQDETSGITAPTIGKWGGPGFTIHLWVCLEYFPHKKNVYKRRQLYSFSTDQGVGMEAFFTADCHLVICVSTRKNYFTVKLNEYPFTDNKWHCLQVIHNPGRKAWFGYSGTVQVYVDNAIKLSTSLRFPSLSNTFTLCHIGSSGHRTNARPSPDPTRSYFNENNSGNTDRVVVIDNGTQDDVWGQATSLLGQLGPVLVINDVLKETQLNTLCLAGPDLWRSSRANGSPFEDIPSSKIVLYYEAKACYRHVCKDLSCNEPARDGRLTGHKIYTWDIKDSINCVGGMPVLTPLLDIIHMRHNIPESPGACFTSIDDDNASPVYKRLGFVKNPVANFICVLTSFVTSSNSGMGWHDINADMMVKCSTMSIIGALLQKITVSLLNENLLWSIQHLVNSISIIQTDGHLLLMDIYQYLLFDFRIWSLSDAPTQCSHVQYLSTLIKENKKAFRQTFGVQYIVDVIKTFYSASSINLPDNDTRNIRCSLLRFVKYYVTDDITPDELAALLNFISASKSNEVQVCEVLNLLKSLWKTKCKDQLRSLLSENRFANYIYSLLGLSEYSDRIRIGVCEVLMLLFESHRISEKHKSFLKQTDVGCHGILWLIQETNVSNRLAALLFDAFKVTDVDGAAIISLANLLHKCDVMTRKSFLQHFLTLAYSKAAFLQDCAKQKAWQDVVTKLFIKIDAVPEVKIQESENLRENPSSLTLSSFGTSYSDVGSNSDAFLNSDMQPSSYLSSPTTLTTRMSISSNTSAEQNMHRSVSNGSVFPSESSSDFIMVHEDEARMGEDLVELAIESLFLLMWRGVVGSDSFAWKERGQVFTCLNRVASSSDLLLDLDEIKARVLEHCVEAALSDVRESSATSGVVKSTGLTFSMATENCAELVRLIYDFLTTDGIYKASLWTEKLIHNLFALYDAAAVWSLNSDFARDAEWTELSNIGFRLLCGCIDTERLELVAMSSAKLHNLIHSRDPSSTEEVCFLLDSLHSSVCRSIQGDSNVKEFVVPLIRDLLDKNFQRLQMGQYLSELPPTTGSSTFFEDFLHYCLSNEWATFIRTCVAPNSDHFKKACYDELTLTMTAFWTATTEDYMVAYHLRERERGDMKLRFKAHFETVFYKDRDAEEERQSKNLKSLKNQNVAVLRQWRAAKRFLASERGIWRDRNPSKTYWKLSNVENFSRMRLKLTENYNFDLHGDASRLRDNLSLDDMKEKPQEALVPPSAILPTSDSSKEDESMGDEDWSMLANHPGSAMDDQSTKEKVVLSKDCQLITLMDVVSGKLEITTTHVYFYDKSSAVQEGGESGMDFKWSLSQLREVHLLRYNLRKSALELFLVDQTNYFINFLEPKLRHTVYKAILSVRPPNLLYYFTRTPQELLKASGLTQKWVQREVDNFDYLMQLNTIAGRTYNDLSQYPVFPWILQDYTSEKLNLDDPDIYRDLSRPIGVLNPKNETEVRDKYEQFEDPHGVISKFHYGSHYSNAATVLFYMLRMEPFTTLHIQLQGGRFDLADRQFHSLAATFQTIMDTTNDVKELIPEFFYMPEFLVNSNGFDLGRLQFAKGVVDDVILPPWAKSPADFVFQHRKALESDYVSANLHNWIDLIFGYKQRGEEAVKAHNVFYYCTYEGAVDLDAIGDAVHRKAVEGMINNFGQTPTQLLTDPHPKRMSREDAARKVLGSRIMSTLNVVDEKCPNVLEQPDQLKAFFVEIMTNSDPLIFATVPKNQSHSFIQSGMPDAMVTVSERGVIGLHGWLPYDRSITNYFTFEKDPAVGHNRLQKSVKGLLSPGLNLSPNIFLTTHDAKYLIIAGYWDNSIRIMSLKGKSVACLSRHLDVVTCLALDNGGSYLMSGSYDNTCIIWKINQQSGLTNSISALPVHILYGHEEVITCVIINSELDVALSSSKDGSCMVHTVRKGHYVRSIRPVGNNPDAYTVPSIAMSEEGRIVLYARTKKELGEEKHFLHLFSINGQHLALDCLEARLGHMTVCGEHLVTGDVRGLLVVREMFSFHEISRLQLCRPISCVFVTKSMTHILACLRDGKLIIVGVDRPAKSRRLFTSTS